MITPAVPDAPVVNVSAVRVPASTSNAPETVSDVKVPVDVILGCAAVVTVPAVVAKATVPLTFAPATALAVAANVTSPDTLAPATAFAVAANVTSPLTFAPATAFAVAVIATCPLTLAPATALAVVAYATAPVTFAPVIALKFAPSPATYVKTPPVPNTLPAEALPVTDNADNVPTLVIFGCAAVVTVPANGGLMLLYLLRYHLLHLINHLHHL